MNQLFHAELDDATNSALEYRRVSSKYRKAFLHYFANTVEPLEADRFWEILEQHYRPLIISNLSKRYAAKDAAWELFRSIKTGERDCTFDDALRFAKSWDEVRRAASNPLFDVVEGRGDDGYGDLMDSLVLVGRDVHEACVRKDYGNNDVFEQQATIALATAVDDYVHATRRPFDADKAEEVSEKFTQWVLHGENYNSMKLKEKAQEWFVINAVDGDTD